MIYINKPTELFRNNSFLYEVGKINQHGSSLSTYVCGHSKPSVRAFKFKVLQGHEIKQIQLKILCLGDVIYVLGHFSSVAQEITIGHFLKAPVGKYMEITEIQNTLKIR